jgi:hypothetical protein
MFSNMQQSEIRMWEYVASLGSISEINHTQYNQLSMGAIPLPLNYYAVFLPRKYVVCKLNEDLRYHYEFKLKQMNRACS